MQNVRKRCGREGNFKFKLLLKRPSETADYTIVQTVFIGQTQISSFFGFVCFSGIILRESNSKQPNTTMPMANNGER